VRWPRLLLRGLPPRRVREVLVAITIRLRCLVARRASRARLVAGGSLPPRLPHGAGLQLQQGPAVRHHAHTQRLLVAVPAGSLALALALELDVPRRADALELAVQPVLHAERRVVVVEPLGAGPAVGRHPQGPEGVRQLLRPVPAGTAPVEPLSLLGLHVKPLPCPL
jgi:hypothetical protein